MEEINRYIYVYKKNRKSYFIKKDIILYVSCHGRVVNLTLPFASVEHNGTLQSARQMLGEDEFVQVNKSQLVNLRYVYYSNLTSVVMCDKKEIPVTPAYSEDFNFRMINMYRRKDKCLHL